MTCPADGAALRLHEGALSCTADPAHRYVFEAGIVRLVPADRRAAVEDRSQGYDADGDAQGWQSPAEDEFKSLPQTGLSGYPEGYWAQQAAATALLWRFLEAVRLQNGKLPVGPVGEAAVIGAGMGWLAYGLDVAGYATLALDARAGSRHGLGVYPFSRYLRVQADALRLPLARGAFDWVIVQEPLAYFGDEAAQQMVLDQALRALRPGGWIAVMDSLSPSLETNERVSRLLESAGLATLAAPRREGWRARLLETRDRLAGREPGVPPVLVAQKAK
jgi:SAM-dependent methyltransferase